MIAAPAARPGTQEARGVDLRGSSGAGNPNYVHVLNPACNGKPTMRRKDADHYVSLGRAEYVGADQLRLIDSHPQNRAAREQAAAGYDGIDSGFYWAGGLSGDERVMMTKRGPAVPGAGRVVVKLSARRFNKSFDRYSIVGDKRVYE